MDVTKRYALSAQASIRPEEFGGLVYRYDNRRLYFLHSAAMADFLRGLDGSNPLEHELDHFLTERKMAAGNKPIFVNALEKLEKLEVIREL